MNIIIAGYGFVGKAVANAIKAHHNLHIVDPQYSTAEVQHFPRSEGIIICVDTPSKSNGECDDSKIRNVIEQTPIYLPILIKSTVLPDQLVQIEKDFPKHNICYSPEFLRDATANKDFLEQKYMVIGGEDPESFWQVLFQKALPNCKLIFKCTNTEASTIKYTANAFLSTKVAFFNQIYDLCEANGSNYDLVRQILTHDIRIGNSHTLVPGIDGRRGFGGKCFPKDTKAFRKYAYGLNKPITILDSAMDYNETVRKDY